MTACYLDTSALIKRYTDEVGSGWLRAMLDARPSIMVVHCQGITRIVPNGT
jgi:predicted nucleic acid-binding protein